MRRRGFLRSMTWLGAGAGLTRLPGWEALTPATAAELRLGPEAVTFRPEIEPVVRWIEETPRDRIISTAVDRLAAGLSYRDLMAGVFLAGIRNVKPRPVGFKFHTVMVIHSAHLLAQSAAVEDRLLPLFYALDTFKASQARDVEEGDWVLERIDEARLPSATEAHRAFDAAMQGWDSEAADAAATALARTRGAGEVMEAFWRYAVRDQRNIGHKPIFAMQSWRTLQAIGWEHAEPVLRSLAFGLLDLQGDGAKQPVGPYETNQERAGRFRDDWMQGRPDAGATRALQGVIREASPDEASEAAAQAIADGIAPGAVWDAVLITGSEMLLAQPGIVPLHAVTAANALHFIFEAAGDDTTRRLAVLQAAGWMPMYRQRLEAGKRIDLTALEAEPMAEGKTEAAIEAAFAAIGTDRQQAARRILGVLESQKEGGSTEPVFDIARRLILRKGTDSHHYKYGAAAWEETRLASDPALRPRLLAAGMAYFPGSSQPDTPVIREAMEACRQKLVVRG